MGRNTFIIPRAPCGRILMKVGAKRVSAKAMDEFADLLTEIGMRISEKAVRIAKHAGRKTVQAEDIKLAAKD